MRTIDLGEWSLCNDCLAVVRDPKLLYHQNILTCPQCGKQNVCRCPGCVDDMHKIYRGDETV